MKIGSWICCGLLLLSIQRAAGADAAPYNQAERSALLATLAASLQPEDFALIEAHANDFSLDQLEAIQHFMTNPSVIAENRWFDVSRYTSWDDYNFYRPRGDVILGNLARRDLFLDPARELDNRALTNMSPQALAALAFSQVYVEEKWDHEVPWDGHDPNSLFNWVQPDVTAAPDLLRFIQGSFLYRQRTEYWWATYWSAPMALAGEFGWEKGSDVEAALRDMTPPNANAPRLSGYSYPVGNQLFLQTAETVYWYADYLQYGAQRYGAFEPKPLDTRIEFPEDSKALRMGDSTADEAQPATNPVLWALFDAPFAGDLRVELSQPESAAFWNVMRFVYAAARQREGGASPEHPENSQPALIALRYQARTPQPVGRPADEISAFALLTTVYSDSILLDFTNWDSSRQALIHAPVDADRSDGIDRQVSERNKAILVVEQMGNENAYPNATHVGGARGLGLNLTTQYDDPQQGDFLPYTPTEAQALVDALVVEARDFAIAASQQTLCNSPLLKQGYDAYASMGGTSWAAAVGTLCG